MLPPWTMYDWGKYPVSIRDRETLRETDGHFCYDWDGLTVSAWTPEYNCCTCITKSRLGRLINRLCCVRYNLGWWRIVGLPDWFRERLQDFDKRFPGFPVCRFFRS